MCLCRLVIVRLSHATAKNKAPALGGVGVGVGAQSSAPTGGVGNNSASLGLPNPTLPTGRAGSSGNSSIVPSPAPYPHQTQNHNPTPGPYPHHNPTPGPQGPLQQGYSAVLPRNRSVSSPVAQTFESRQGQQQQQQYSNLREVVSGGSQPDQQQQQQQQPYQNDLSPTQIAQYAQAGSNMPQQQGGPQPPRGNPSYGGGYPGGVNANMVENIPREPSPGPFDEDPVIRLERYQQQQLQARAVLQNMIGPNGGVQHSTDPYNTTVSGRARFSLLTMSFFFRLSDDFHFLFWARSSSGAFRVSFRKTR